jgi:elongation factor P
MAAPASNQINPGMTISLDGKIYRVESSVKVTVAKGVPFIKTKLKNLVTDEIIEKNFKVDQVVEEVALIERVLEYLYMEGKDYLCLNIEDLEQVLVPASIISDKVNYLN